MVRFIEWISTKFVYAQITIFLVGKIFFGIVEMPNVKDTIPHLLFLILTFIFYVLAIVFKMLRHKKSLLRSLIHIQAECFLLWVITILLIIFGWSLCYKLQWSIVEIIFLVLCQISQMIIFTLVANEKFISKLEFISYQIILSITVIVLALRTVLFLTNDDSSQNKDIVLLNLTTQIALSILVMDVIEREYSKFKAIQEPKTEKKNSLEVQLTMQK